MSVDEAESLGESVNGHPENVDAALPRLLELLQSADTDVVEAATRALGHAWEPRAAQAIVPFARNATDPFTGNAERLIASWELTARNLLE